MNQLIETTEKKLFRDPTNMALVETDTSKKDAYLAQRKMLADNKANREQINTLQEQIARLESLVNTLAGNK